MYWTCLYRLTLWISQYRVCATERPPSYGGSRHIKVVEIVRMERANVKISINGEESPLSPCVSLYCIHSVVSNGTIDFQWWWRGPAQHDQGRAKCSTIHILRGSSRNYTKESLKIIMKIHCDQSNIWSDFPSNCSHFKWLTAAA